MAEAAAAEKAERRILVAVDESEESMYALTWCLNNLVSPNFDDTLFLVYAKRPPAVYTGLDGTGRRDPLKLSLSILQFNSLSCYISACK